jgi:hypothetical protein
MTNLHNSPKKYCPGCQQEKPFSDFHKSKRGPLKLEVYCKPCRSIEAKGRYKKKGASNIGKLPIEPGEIWKDIKGYEGLYQVSNRGRVKRLGGSNKCWKERILSVRPKADGYTRVALSKNNKIEYARIHRLVADAFIPAIENKPFINHKDLNRSNNNVENLEWCTHQENMNHRNELLPFKRVTKSGIENKRSIPVLQMALDGTPLKEWPNALQAAKTLGCSDTGIRRVCLGKRGGVTYFNCKWAYIRKVS